MPRGNTTPHHITSVETFIQISNASGNKLHQLSKLIVLINYFVVISLAKYVGHARLASNEHSLTQGDRSLDELVSRLRSRQAHATAQVVPRRGIRRRSEKRGRQSSRTSLSAAASMSHWLIRHDCHWRVSHVRWYAVLDGAWSRFTSCIGSILISVMTRSSVGRSLCSFTDTDFTK